MSTIHMYVCTLPYTQYICISDMLVGFCYTEVTEVRGAVVQWPQTSVGQVAVVPCPCMGGSGKTISRRCGQDGLWGEVDETQCKVKLSYYVRRLCGVVSQ